jgi:hypothetical protein
MHHYKPKYFDLKELVDSMSFAAIASQYQLWMQFDERILRAADILREEYGEATINNWAYGGDKEWRGFRTPRCNQGSRFSSHRYGRALDIVFKKIDAGSVRIDIANDEKHPVRKYITAMENAGTWLHIDCRNTDGKFEVF